MMLKRIPSTLPHLEASASQAGSRAMFRCVGLLLGSAIMIAVDRRGWADGLAKQVIGWAGLVLGLSAGLWLLLIWQSNRFRTSIGRLMTLVVIVAVFCEGTLIYRDWLRASLRQHGGPIPTPVQQKPVPIDEFFLPGN